jgi:hypothetical protein
MSSMFGRREYKIKLTDFQLQILTDGLKKLRENERYDPVTKKELKNILSAFEQARYEPKENT